MTAPLFETHPFSAPQPPLLFQIRLAAMTGRTDPRASIASCALVDPALETDKAARLLVQIVAQGLDRRPVFWRPGSEGQSFDESWLIALARAIRVGDTGSERFLTERRVRPPATRILRHFLEMLGARLDIT